MTWRPPDAVLDMARRGPDWAAWVDLLPGRVRELVDEWQLSVDGETMHGFCAAVIPVRTHGGAPAVLKVAFPDEESQHEHLALQHWAGNGAVRLLRADPARSAMLLERLHPETLDELWDVEACEIVGGLYGRLHIPATPQLVPLASYVERWLAALATLERGAPIPRRMVDHALSAGRELIADTAGTSASANCCTATCTTTTCWPPTANRGWRSTPRPWPVTRTMSQPRCCGIASRNCPAT